MYFVISVFIHFRTNNTGYSLSQRIWASYFFHLASFLNDEDTSLRQSSHIGSKWCEKQNKAKSLVCHFWLQNFFHQFCFLSD